MRSLRLADLYTKSVDGTVIAWRIKAGEHLDFNQDMLELEGHKLVLDLKAPLAGTVKKINIQEGEPFSYTDVLFEIDEEPGQNLAANLKKQTQLAQKARDDAAKAEAKTLAGVNITPALRRYALHNNVDLSKIVLGNTAKMVKKTDIDNQINFRNLFSKQPAKEKDYPEAENIDTVIIGAGPGGYTAAIRASELGEQVTLIEKNKVGGTCLNIGCIPSKALINAGHRFAAMASDEQLGMTQGGKKNLDYTKTQQWKQSIVDKLVGGVQDLIKEHQVDLRYGNADFLDLHHLRLVSGTKTTILAFKRAVIATGSRPRPLADFPFKKRVIDSTSALSLPKVPEHLLVDGGGYIGTELASAYADLGAKVIIIQHSKRLLSKFDESLVKVVTANLQRKGVEIITEAPIKKVENTKTTVTVTYEKNGEQQIISGDYLLVTVGRLPNTEELGLENLGLNLTKQNKIIINDQCQTNREHIFAIGDVTPGIMLEHRATNQARVLGAILAGKETHVNYTALPEIVYSDPEMAVTGLSKKAAIEAGYHAATAQFPFGANGRALTLNVTTGFLRLVFDDKTKQIIGAQIVGPNASELIAELTTVIENELTLDDVAKTIHAHPTLAETIVDAAEVGLGLPINI
ncbi:dihydrolipoyl dehydrogenase [Loigolactobacillus backii]|uniref:dihydrolipoyl dehydrogenase n=1 Tax=Loigolactobacillus backii TaxID=375175 RepID=UPI000C1CB710|nr:dihydrolipoyl dehydrogenase [Loigolactobacillus backii]PIO82286.1 dihydrolipoyl dehydrogenase [Loigolactobacillus backii]